MNKIKTVKICPKCQVSDYYISNGMGGIGGQTNTYNCNNCGFSGTIFPPIGLDKLAKLKKVKKTRGPGKTKLKSVKPSIKLSLKKILVILLLILLTYTAYRFGFFDFVQSPHEHAVRFFSKYEHLR